MLARNMICSSRAWSDVGGPKSTSLLHDRSHRIARGRHRRRRPRPCAYREDLQCATSIRRRQRSRWEWRWEANECSEPPDTLASSSPEVVPSRSFRSGKRSVIALTQARRCDCEYSFSSIKLLSFAREAIITSHWCSMLKKTTLAHLNLSFDSVIVNLCLVFRLLLTH